MIGVYNYTVVLTYLSLISALTGIFTSLHGNGHPFLGVFFLMICGCCDAFDGKVARTKKNRSDLEKNYGIQIDSLADIVAFGVLPACIGDSMLWNYPKLDGIPHLITDWGKESWMTVLILAVIIFYAMAALIRLAYFNVTEEERSRKEGGVRKYYEGLPVTGAALIFPFVMLLQYIIVIDLTPVYFLVMFIVGVCFIVPIKIPKPSFRMVLVLVAIGAIEAFVLGYFHDAINVL